MPRSMSRLHRHLEKKGYSVVDWSYPSGRYRIERHRDSLREQLLGLDADPEIRQIHIVGHSLGGIVARFALAEGLPVKMGRLVMLAPPNQGSSLARQMAPVFGWLIPVLPQLGDGADSVVKKTPSIPGLKIGVIAGSHDMTTPTEVTHLGSETDHLVVDSGHTFIMNKKVVLKQVAHFLLHGRFER